LSKLINDVTIVFHFYGNHVTFADNK
jgi:hypothetical protein